MENNPKRPMRVESGNSLVVPVIGGLALIIALFFGWQMMNSKTDQAANPTSQTSSTGASSGETGQSTVQADPNMKANPGAAAAPTKAPITNTSAADTQPQP